MNVIIMIGLLIAFCECKVLFVAEIVRNGISTPQINMTKFFPDTNFEYKDEISAGGLRQLYLLGRIRRDHYIEKTSFLPLEFNPGLIHARATESRKSQMSAQAYLLGLYPNGLLQFNEKQLNRPDDILKPPIKLQISDDLIPRLGQQAVPRSMPLIHIHVQNSTVERMLRVMHCPLFDQTIKSYFYTDEWKKLRNEYAATWEKIKAAYPKIEDSWLNTEANAYDLAEFLTMAEASGKRPLGITKEIGQNLNKLLLEATKGQFHQNSQIVTISIHELALEILNKMNNSATTQTPSFNLYVPHSHSMMAFLLAMKSIKPELDINYANFAANILIELSESETLSGTQTVTIFYNGEEVHKEEFNSFYGKLNNLADFGTKTYEKMCAIPNTLNEITISSEFRNLRIPDNH